jgi:hypothetical protein
MLSVEARMCPNQNPTQLRKTYKIRRPIFPPRHKWKAAPMKLEIRIPKIMAGIVIIE